MHLALITGDILSDFFLETIMVLFLLVSWLDSVLLLSLGNTGTGLCSPGVLLLDLCPDFLITLSVDLLVFGSFLGA